MKTIILTLFVLTLCLNAPAQKKATDREIERLKGAVKTIVEDYMLTNVSSGPSKVNVRVKSKEYYFDQNGNLTEKLYPSSNSKNTYSIIDGYKTIKILPIKVDNSPKDSRRSVFATEDEPIEKPEKLVPPDDRFTLKYVYEYDSKGRIKTEREYLNNGKLTVLKTLKYDEKGQVIEETRNDTVAITKYTHKYDKNGNLIETLEDRNIKSAGIDSTSKTVFSDYKSDAQGNWTQRKRIYSTVNTEGDTFSTTTIDYRLLTYY